MKRQPWVGNQNCTRLPIMICRLTKGTLFFLVRKEGCKIVDKYQIVYKECIKKTLEVKDRERRTRLGNDTILYFLVFISVDYNHFHIVSLVLCNLWLVKSFQEETEFRHSVFHSSSLDRKIWVEQIPTYTNLL